MGGYSLFHIMSFQKHLRMKKIIQMNSLFQVLYNQIKKYVK